MNIVRSALLLILLLTPLPGTAAENADATDAALIASALLGQPLPDGGTRGIGVAARPSTLTLNVQFDLNSSRIAGGASQQLDLLFVALLRPEIAGKWIEISGHTDSKGSDAYNLKLSGRRAAAVRDYLLSKGGDLSTDHLVALGVGEQQPLIASDPQNPRNRRVEVRLIAPPGT